MFGLFKRRSPVTAELDQAIIEAMFDEIDSDDEREFERVSEHTSNLLDTLTVDIKRRKFLWSDATPVGIAEVAQRIHQTDPTMSVDDIDFCITQWLEQSYCPEGISVEAMDKLQINIEQWIEAHQGGVENV